MNEEIKRILKRNHIDTDEKLVRINNEDAFLKTYKYNGSKKHTFPEDVKRDENGYLVLDNVPFLSYDTYDTCQKCKKLHWILCNNGSKILVKSKDLSIYENELLIMYFLKELNIKCANYDIASLNGEIYLTSTCFLRNSEYLFDTFSKPLNIETCFEESRMYKSEIHYLKTLFIDRILGNMDRFPYNYKMINSTKGHVRIAPLFDNGEYCFILDSCFYPSVHEKNDIDVVLNYLLGYDEIKDWVKKHLSSANLDKLVERLKEEKGIIVSNETYTNFENHFKDSEQMVNDELKSLGETFRISLTK